MDFANRFTLEEEIRGLIESDNPVILVTQEDLDNLIKNNIFPLTNYLYRKSNLEDIIDLWRDLINNKEIEEFYYKKNRLFRFKNCEPLEVKISISEKNTKHYVNIIRELKKEKISVKSVVDLEFFEYYPRDLFLLNYIIGNTDNILKKHKDENFKKIVKKEIDNLFLNHQAYLEFFGEDKFCKILECFDEKEKLDKNKFTTFLDTEKIHLQFIECSKNNKKEYILGYFGYGNHYPFTRNLPGKKICENRFNVFDKLKNDNCKFLTDYYVKQFNNDPIIRLNNILEKISVSNKNYEDFFNLNFSYNARRDMFSEKNPLETMFSKYFDGLLMINPKLRCRTSSLIAYKILKDVIFSNDIEGNFGSGNFSRLNDKTKLFNY